MNDWQITRHRVAIAGRVLDAATGKPVAAAAVSITTMPEAFERKLALASLAHGNRWDALKQRPDRTSTRDDGLFYFLDLPDGAYGLTASLPGQGNRYGTAQEPATVARDKQGDTRIAFVNLTLQATGVTGKITAAGQKSGVMLAEVRVRGSGERTFSDVQGQYLLAGVEPGKRTILVSAQGYKAKSQSISIPSPGALPTVNFTLARDT
jgi:hypothetical protein